jgi:hypothetical protein
MVVSVIKNPYVASHRPSEFGEGDLLRVHFRTTDPEFIAERLEELVGKQEGLYADE